MRNNGMRRLVGFSKSIKYFVCVRQCGGKISRPKGMGILVIGVPPSPNLSDHKF
jgi:hypothetical protein